MAFIFHQNMSSFNNNNNNNNIEPVPDVVENHPTTEDNDPVGDKSLPKDHPFYNIPLNFNIVTPTYNNNSEYREALKTLCFLRYPESFPDGDFPEGTDQESCHEMTYDIENMTYALDFVWQNTKTHPQFIELYQIAALEMFTEDLEVGLAILFSYDYLRFFYPIFREYMVCNKQFTESYPYYIVLKQKLCKK